MRPIAVFGGTFDPVHNAHLALARTALAVLDPARILWIPTGTPPYREPPVAPALHRVAMLELVVAGEARFAIDRRELAPDASGYTVDTLGALRTELGEAVPLVLLMGADQYRKLGTWHRSSELSRLCRLAVFTRPGERLEDAAVRVVPLAPLEISSTEIRERIGRGEDVAALLPAQVLEYIRRHRLYGHP
ncbi:MAG: nicotinate (nicotinamide) nucleotide adenylyltransferase [Betaproteobacteria bacterium RIFCSPLOWO2_02_FULL_66_14]|nr:MAG: nicotinate (nicotinamide) nucleotide adenylyltransferase [Betaproteobacteria bacterium RIFCSPLOWO2_02_FULL_66_14]